MGALVTLLLLLLVPPALAQDAARCTRTLTKAAELLRTDALGTRARCEDDKLQGRVAPDVDCRVTDVDRVRNRAARKVARACGGRDRRCGTSDDEHLAAIGWDVATCPGIAGDDPSHCRDPIEHCGDVTECLACIAAEAAGGVGSYYAARTPAADEATARCQRTVGRAAAKLARTSSEKVRQRALAAVCKACGGPDRKCDGAGDIAPADIAFDGECPAFVGPNGRTCAGPLADAADVVTCAECLAAARFECVAESTAPSVDPQPEECTACCGPRRMVLESVAGGSFSFGALAPFELPAGIRFTLDVGPPDQACRHDVVVPPGGLDFPAYCLGDFPYTGDVLPSGCPIGGALGRGVLWDGRALAAEADLGVTADTSDALCNPRAQECSLQELAAGANFLGGSVVAPAGSATRGLHLRLDLPTETVAWEDPEGQCPDQDGARDGDGDQTVTDTFQVSRFTTGESSALFDDLNADACTYTGLGPGTVVARAGAPAVGPCCTPGQQLTLVATTPAFTGGAPFGDLLTTFSLPLQVVACEPWPGPPAATCDALEGGGRVVIKLAARADDLAAVAIGSDGAIVAAGHSDDGFTGEALAVVRYLPDGALDPAFGAAGDGRVRTDIGFDARGRALALRDDGTIVVAGFTRADAGGPRDVLLARYTADGALDDGFGSGGMLVHSFSAGDDGAEAVARDAQGRLVVAGYLDNGTDDDVLVARFLENGAPDGEFGSGGFTTVDFGSSDDAGLSVAVQDDGRILVAVRAGETPAARRGAVVRLLDGGAPDPDFGSAGIVVLDVPGSSDHFLRALALQDDGRILVAGTAALDLLSARFLVGRLLTDGAPDPEFAGGIVPLDTALANAASAVRPLADGSVVVAGWTEVLGLPPYDNDFLVARYTTTGQLDGTFGDGGVRIVPFGGAGDQANALAVAPGGSLVVAGVHRPQLFSYQLSFALARLLADGRLDPTFNGQCPWR